MTCVQKANIRSPGLSAFIVSAVLGVCGRHRDDLVIWIARIDHCHEAEGLWQFGLLFRQLGPALFGPDKLAMLEPAVSEMFNMEHTQMCETSLNVEKSIKAIGKRDSRPNPELPSTSFERRTMETKTCFT